MKHSETCYRERDRGAERRGYLSRCHHEGLGRPVYKGSRSKREGAVVLDGTHIAGGDLGNIALLPDERGGQPR